MVEQAGWWSGLVRTWAGLPIRIQAGLAVGAIVLREHAGAWAGERAAQIEASCSAVAAALAVSIAGSMAKTVGEARTRRPRAPGLGRVQQRWEKLSADQRSWLLRIYRTGRRHTDTMPGDVTEEREYEQLVEWGYLASTSRHGERRGMRETRGDRAVMTTQGWEEVEAGLRRNGRWWRRG